MALHESGFQMSDFGHLLATSRSLTALRTSGFLSLYHLWLLYSDSGFKPITHAQRFRPSALPQDARRGCQKHASL